MFLPGTSLDLCTPLNAHFRESNFQAVFSKAFLYRKHIYKILNLNHSVQCLFCEFTWTWLCFRLILLRFRWSIVSFLVQEVYKVSSLVFINFVKFLVKSFDCLTFVLIWDLKSGACISKQEDLSSRYLHNIKCYLILPVEVAYPLEQDLSSVVRGTAQQKCTVTVPK